jgi:hypothetical protein
MILVIFFLLGTHGFSQTETSNLKLKLNRIKAVPYWYTVDNKKFKGKQKDFKSVDINYVDIIKSDTSIIRKLTNFLADTGSTEIKNSCDGGYFTFGQLAFLLINDIEDVPLFLVTKSQWDVLECGILPTGVLNYLKVSGDDFKVAYQVYLNSKERQDRLSEMRLRKP